MFSPTAEYALRALVQLADSPDRPLTVQEISETTSVSATYLAKILGRLARSSLVESRRGPSGGFLLGRSADRVTVFEVIQAVDPWKKIDRCPLGRASHEQNLCPLHRKLLAAQATAEAALSETSLTDLVRDAGLRLNLTGPP